MFMGMLLIEDGLITGFFASYREPLPSHLRRSPAMASSAPAEGVRPASPDTPCPPAASHRTPSSSVYRTADRYSRVRRTPAAACRCTLARAGIRIPQRRWLRVIARSIACPLSTQGSSPPTPHDRTASPLRAEANSTRICAHSAPTPPLLATDRWDSLASSPGRAGSSATSAGDGRPPPAPWDTISSPLPPPVSLQRRAARGVVRRRERRQAARGTSRRRTAAARCTAAGGTGNTRPTRRQCALRVTRRLQTHRPASDSSEGDAATRTDGRRTDRRRGRQNWSASPARRPPSRSSRRGRASGRRRR